MIRDFITKLECCAGHGALHDFKLGDNYVTLNWCKSITVYGENMVMFIDITEDEYSFLYSLLTETREKVRSEVIAKINSEFPESEEAQVKYIEDLHEKYYISKRYFSFCYKGIGIDLSKTVIPKSLCILVRSKIDDEYQRRKKLFKENIISKYNISEIK